MGSFLYGRCIFFKMVRCACIRDAIVVFIVRVCSVIMVRLCIEYTFITYVYAFLILYDIIRVCLKERNYIITNCNARIYTFIVCVRLPVLCFYYICRVISNFMQS